MEKRIIIDAEGQIRFIHDDNLMAAFRTVGTVETKRASHVEPEGDAWFADLSPSGGPKLGPFLRRDVAIAAEIDWLNTHNIPI